MLSPNLVLLAKERGGPLQKLGYVLSFPNPICDVYRLIKII